MQTELILDAAACEAVIFDMDGVLTDTTPLHVAAWKETFDAFLASRAEARGEEFEPFDPDRDYRRFVDGRPRHDGIRTFLGSRDIELPEGQPDDGPDEETISGLGNRKNASFRKRLASEGVTCFDDALALVRNLGKAGISLAVVSSSRNAGPVLQRAGIADLFDCLVDGTAVSEGGLRGKPAPDALLEAARLLEARPERSAIVEDAEAGVEAGRSGGFRWVVGVARSGNAGDLERAGADPVVADLSAIAVDERAERPIAALPSAQDRIGRIARRIGTRQPVVFLDFDGTLAPIVDDPDDAALPRRGRELLARLATHRTIAVVSGRDLDDLRKRVGVDGLFYAGSHGIRLAGPGGWTQELDEAGRFLPALDRAEAALADRLAGLAGVTLERKRFALAIHYRQAGDPVEARVRRAAEEVAEASGELRVASGRMVIELRPALDWGKREAIRRLLEVLELRGEKVFPIYIGDDLTDEDAFDAIRSDGLPIVVRGRDGTTRAWLALDDPPAVLRFLAELNERLLLS